MKIVKLFSLLAFVAVTTFSCKKDEVVDNTTLLTTGKWKQTAETSAGVDTYTRKLACEKDNTWAFATTGVVTLDEGATKCDPADVQSETAIWAFSGTDKKTVIVTISGFALTFAITELTATSLKWQYTNPLDSKVVIESYSK